MDIGNNTLVNVDLISGIRFSKDEEGKSTIIIHAGDQIFTSDLPLEEILNMLKSIRDNTQHWAGR